MQISNNDPTLEVTLAELIQGMEPQQGGTPSQSVLTFDLPNTFREGMEITDANFTNHPLPAFKKATGAHKACLYKPDALRPHWQVRIYFSSGATIPDMLLQNPGQELVEAVRAAQERPKAPAAA